MPSFFVWMAIGLGAVLGAWGRFALGLWLNREQYPWGTLAANWIGAYVIGFAVVWLSTQPHLPGWVKYALVTGFLGALTTFSTFSLESVEMVMAGRWQLMVGHVLAHTLGAIAFVFLGMFSAQAL